MAATQAWGALYVIFLQADGSPRSIRRLDHHDLLPFVSLAGLYHASVTAIHDVDGNGLPDLAIDLPEDSAHGQSEGAVVLASLDAAGGIVAAHRIAAGEGGFDGVLQPEERFGWAVAALGDVNGDGHGDLIVGAPTDNDGAIVSGSVWVLFLDGAGQVLREQKISNHHGLLGPLLDSGDRFGSALAGLGDLDRDGVPDVAVASPLAQVGASGGVGEVHLLFLDAQGRVASSRLLNDDLPTPSTTGDRFGTGLAGTAGMPQLVTTGTLAGGSTITHVVSGAPPLAPTWLIAGLDLLEAPFKFGVMVPSLDVVIDGLLTDAAGGLALQATWPAGVPADLPVHQQDWFVDAGGPAGFCASNGVTGTTP